MNKIEQVLFVCLGNTARSPAAEYLARDRAKKLNVSLMFDSCGFINAFSFIQPESRKYLDSKGISYADFIPKIINRNLLEKQDLILTMEKRHVIEIINTFDEIEDIKEKTFTLKEFNGETTHIDIIDPYYTTNKTYKKVLRIIDEFIEKTIKKIVHINSI